MAVSIQYNIFQIRKCEDLPYSRSCFIYQIKISQKRLNTDSVLKKKYLITAGEKQETRKGEYYAQ